MVQKKKNVFSSRARDLLTAVLKYWVLQILFEHFRFISPSLRCLTKEYLKLFNKINSIPRSEIIIFFFFFSVSTTLYTSRRQFSIVNIIQIFF